MPNYNLYMAEKNIAPKDIICALRPAYKTSKMHVSCAVHSAESGLCFEPEAEKLIVAAYGDGPGLVCSGGEASAPQAKKPKPNRRKPHRLVVYVDDPLFRRIQSAASSRGYVTMQGFLESLLYKLEEEEKEDPHEV